MNTPEHDDDIAYLGITLPSRVGDHYQAFDYALEISKRHNKPVRFEFNNVGAMVSPDSQRQKILFDLSVRRSLLAGHRTPIRFDEKDMDALADTLEEISRKLSNHAVFPLELVLNEKLVKVESHTYISKEWLKNAYEKAIDYRKDPEAQEKALLNALRFGGSADASIDHRDYDHFVP